VLRGEEIVWIIWNTSKFLATLGDVIDEAVKRQDSRIEKRLERREPTDNGLSIDQVPTGTIMPGRPFRR